jgi:hypothetical protein
VSPRPLTPPQVAWILDQAGLVQGQDFRIKPDSLDTIVLLATNDFQIEVPRVGAGHPQRELTAAIERLQFARHVEQAMRRAEVA